MKKKEFRVKEELDIMYKLKHPNILALLDWGFGHSSIYIVTELVNLFIIIGNGR